MSITIRPQDRDFNGEKVTFLFKDGKRLEESKAFSIPMDTCTCCPLYKIDTRTAPIAYYCQSQFVSSYNFSEAIKTKKVPDRCKMWHTEMVRKIINQQEEKK